MQQYNKALAALLAPIVVMIAARYGLNWSVEEAGVLVAVVTSIVVYAVPNKVKFDHDIQSYIAALEEKVQAMEAQAHTGQPTEEPLTLHREEKA